jgi:PAS domain S-box-containing protein
LVTRIICDVRLTPDRHWLSAGSRRGSAAFATGLAIELVLAVIDITLLPPNVLVTIGVLLPLLCALYSRPRHVAIVGGVAVALVLASGAWRDDFAQAPYLQRVFIVAVGGFLAVMAAAGRARIGLDRERFAALAAIAEIADGTRSLEDTVTGLNDVLVPAVADVCVIDAVSQGELQRLAVRVAGRDGAAIARAIATSPPSAIARDAPSTPVLAEHVTDDVLRGICADPDDLGRLRALDPTSAIVVPLRARGRSLGALTLLLSARSGRRYDNGDLEFVKVLGGRAALALDNAGLFSELETIEAQLTAALSTLAEAVTVQHAGGALIYANEAAVEMMGFDSPQEVLSTPISEVVGRFDPRTEDGSPLRMEDLPGRRVLAGEPNPEPLIIHGVNKQTGEERWHVTKASGVYDREGNVKLVVNVIEDITEVKRAEVTQRLLARAGAALASSLDYERTLQQVADLAVPQLADWCAVSMPDRRGQIQIVAVAHADPQKVAFARAIAARYPSRADRSSGVAKVIHDGESQLINEIPEEMLAEVAQDEEHLKLLRSVGMRAGLTVPMSAGGTTVGALSLLSAESGRRFSAADVELAEELARRAGTAVENARLYTERSHIAHTLQTGLLPGRLPHMPGWETATLYRSAGDESWVGGDFYDAFAVRGGWLALVGDVAGRGAEAAALTGVARHTLKTAATLLDDPLAAIGTLNAELLGHEQMALCSIAAVLLREHEASASAEVICAGHPLPLLVRGGAVRPVGSFAPMLGAYAISAWERTTVELERGDVLVLYTDGVFDAVGDGERFGEERLERTLEDVTDAQDAVARIDAALSAFAVGEQADDTAVLAVGRVAVASAARARRPRAEREGSGA